MRFVFVSVALTSLLALAAGCASSGDEDTDSSASEVSATVHEPQGDERKAILGAMREALEGPLHGQAVLFNSTNPVGRFQAHGDWAFFSGILEGPNGNQTPIDYANSEYKWAWEGGWLEGVQRGGHFAANYVAAIRKGGDGRWHVATENWGGSVDYPTMDVGAAGERWIGWASMPPPAMRDVFPYFPFDDAHEPQDAERRAIIGALRDQISPTVNGQTILFNSTSPRGSFISHDGWVLYVGIIEGPDGNATPVDYRNSVYRQRMLSGQFKGVMQLGNFAANVSALLHKEADGSFKVVTVDGKPTYAVGEDEDAWHSWVNVPSFSVFAWDIFPYGGEGGGGH